MCRADGTLSIYLDVRAGTSAQRIKIRWYKMFRAFGSRGHGGELKVATKEVEGAEFIILLPVK